MINKEKISSNLRTIEAMTQNGASPPLDQYWNEIVHELSEDLKGTREYLLSCNPDDIELMSGYFEDVAYKLQDESFIDLLNELQTLHPDIDIKNQIQWAIDALD
ncbi:hypothetical protein EBB07_14405 [Paenibacillaceae bacterium]|nr:hypothetical protein EBB07_14405 [Paenibacillaceae bacterium]